VPVRACGSVVVVYKLYTTTDKIRTVEICVRKKYELRTCTRGGDLGPETETIEGTGRDETRRDVHPKLTRPRRDETFEDTGRDETRRYSKSDETRRDRDI
jgi:hypothetical protein